MNEELEILEAKFRCFLNKTIIGASKDFYKKQMRYEQKELRIFDDENFSWYIDELTRQDDIVSDSLLIELCKDSKSLSEIEKAVIFLYYKDKFRINEIAKILRMNEDSIGKINKRAINKLRDEIGGEF